MGLFLPISFILLTYCDRWTIDLYSVLDSVGRKVGRNCPVRTAVGLIMIHKVEQQNILDSSLASSK